LRHAPTPRHRAARLPRWLRPGAAIATCQREGLSPAQLACIVAVKDWAPFTELAACPAIQAKRPSWLQLR
jgi:hypothetical protein